MVTLFFSYSHKDEALRDELEKHLASLKHQDIIDTWHDRRIEAGEEWATQIDDHLRTADIILLLISADFIASEYCYDLEMNEALRRHKAGEAKVIPVILRPCDWHDLPFGKLQAATRDGRAVVKFPTLDDGFLEVVRAIKAAAKSMHGKTAEVPFPQKQEQRVKSQVVPTISGPRSSDLRVRQSFADHDRDTFMTDSFEYIAAYFENSLAELAARNPRLKTQFRRRDANSFEAAIYSDGKQTSKCGIWLGGSSFMEGIAFSYSGLGNGNSFNESMSVMDDGYSLGLKPLGMAFHSSGQRDALLTQEGSAEYFWEMLMQPLR
ncbi:toll/interleukin-1 receptor domain-containing protein [Thiobacillus sp.]|uniref:toll/interleukin-1 receptor domain-containing protein n=1 Tax=Thiobacillus sp. TaxID=924 RepID=UPI00181E13AB|nr:toll/interleukin-1 receptor domain-containing protein [Thiobacillus sp.]MBC2730816.1 toll/interleukin-1 receptor domain-containing protein [Thiobacillus sp.]MBC2739553.1 toll/interleukin-1 receptor domain-containing protein [Thiobacillus sp.]MBC2760163.1 toll/interleukin-1 receptor domain-containing protein [Thiobacillus sp.]